MSYVFFEMRIFFLGHTSREVREFRLISRWRSFRWAQVILQSFGRITRESPEIVLFDGDFLAWGLGELSVFCVA